MIVVMAAHATEAEIKEVEQRITDWGYGVHPIYGAQRTVIGAVGVPEADKARYMESLESLPYVEQVVAILKPYKLASREINPETTVVDVKGVPIGGNHITLMAGALHRRILRTDVGIGESLQRGGRNDPARRSLQTLDFPLLVSGARHRRLADFARHRRQTRYEGRHRGHGFAAGGHRLPVRRYGCRSAHEICRTTICCARSAK